MALSGSIHGSSSLKTTSDKYKISQNFDNEEFSSDFEVYMSTHIGRGQMKNYDNFYINGLYSAMNVAKTSYHIKGKGKNAVFAVCRGVENTEGCFEASRKVMEYLDEQRENILEAKSLSEIEKKLADFSVSCNNMLLSDGITEKHKVSLMIVVYAFSGAVFMNSGDCSLITADKKGRCKLLTSAADALGDKREHSFEIKRIRHFLTSRLTMCAENINNSELEKLEKSLSNKMTLKEKIIELSGIMTSYNDARSCTCVMIDENTAPSVRLSTKRTAVVCAAAAAVSVINIIVQLCLHI